jgi:hypothetical protein
MELETRPARERRALGRELAGSATCAGVEASRGGKAQSRELALIAPKVLQDPEAGERTISANSPGFLGLTEGRWFKSSPATMND